MEIDRNETLKTLNEIVELELAGTVRFVQYSLMVFGHARIPIMGWMRDQAQQSMAHAIQAGEEVTALGRQRVAGRSVSWWGTHHPSVDDILQEMLDQRAPGASSSTSACSAQTEGRERLARGARSSDGPQRVIWTSPRSRRCCASGATPEAGADPASGPLSDPVLLGTD